MPSILNHPCHGVEKRQRGLTPLSLLDFHYLDRGYSGWGLESEA